MPYPVNFATLAGGNEPASLLDTQFQQVAAMIDIPSSVSGTNALSITPLVNCPVLGGYTEFCAARFRAVATSTAAVTAQFNGLGFLPVYHNDGVTQATLGDVVVGFEYVVRFSQSLNGGGGGWFLEAPSVPVVTQPYFTTGGRLTFQSSTPVMTSNSLTPQTVFYAPYVHPFVPVYNGSTIQMYQFTSSQADQVGLSLVMGGSANWPINTNFDVFATLNGTQLELVTVPWTNQTTRATNLAIFGGFLTNATNATCRSSSTTTFTLLANQGTFLGTFATAGTAGQSLWQYGAAASGGSPANFLLCNYYNKVSVNTIVIDNGAPYTYTSATVRSARASANNAIFYIQSDSERTAMLSYQTNCQSAAVNSIMNTGIGVTNSAFNIFQAFEGYGTNFGTMNTTYSLTSTGLTSIFALEASDGSHASTFGAFAGFLFGTIWL